MDKQKFRAGEAMRYTRGAVHTQLTAVQQARRYCISWFARRLLSMLVQHACRTQPHTECRKRSRGILVVKPCRRQPVIESS